MQLLSFAPDVGQFHIETSDRHILCEDSLVRRDCLHLVPGLRLKLEVTMHSGEFIRLFWNKIEGKIWLHIWSSKRQFRIVKEFASRNPGCPVNPKYLKLLLEWVVK
jgi:hypothetical protein